LNQFGIHFFKNSQLVALIKYLRLGMQSTRQKYLKNLVESALTELEILVCLTSKATLLCFSCCLKIGRTNKLNGNNCEAAKPSAKLPEFDQLRVDQVVWHNRFGKIRITTKISEAKWLNIY
jgi:hypothetical protein